MRRRSGLTKTQKQKMVADRALARKRAKIAAGGMVPVNHTFSGFTFPYPWRRRAFRMSEPKARVEDLATWRTRVEKMIRKAADADYHNTIAEKNNGRALGTSGFTIVATDGHMMLTRRCPPDQSQLTNPLPRAYDGDNYSNPGCSSLELRPEFHLAVTRALVFAKDPDSRKDPEITIQIKDGHLWVKSINSSGGRTKRESDTFEEYVEGDTVGGLPECRFRVNGKHLESALGVWPVLMKWQSIEGEVKEYIILEVGTDDRFVIMPFKD